MKFLDGTTLSEALMRCYKNPGVKTAIVFSSDEHYAEFSDIMLGMAVAGNIDGVRAPLCSQGECEGIEFLNGSYIRFLVNRPQKDEWFYKVSEPYGGYDETIYDYDEHAHELDEFLDSFKIIE